MATSVDQEQLELELKRLREETAILETIRRDMQSGVETRRTVGLFLVGVVAALAVTAVVFFLSSHLGTP